MRVAEKGKRALPLILAHIQSWWIYWHKIKNNIVPFAFCFTLVSLVHLYLTNLTSLEYFHVGVSSQKKLYCRVVWEVKHGNFVSNKLIWFRFLL